MALTNFGKAAVSAVGLGLIGVFLSAAAPAFAESGADGFAGNLTQSQHVIVVSEGHPAPKLNLLLLPHSPETGNKVG